jgi:hypothetical protein
MRSNSTEEGSGSVENSGLRRADLHVARLVFDLAMFLKTIEKVFVLETTAEYYGYGTNYCTGETTAASQAPGSCLLCRLLPIRREK